MSPSKKKNRKLDACPDTPDFRDLIYRPTLVEVPGERSLAKYRDEYPDGRVPVLDQGQEGACTGYGLAAVVNYLLITRKFSNHPRPDAEKLASPAMLYTLARRYDEWRGEDYEGSSARGAIKGWHKHGVCADELWKSHRGKRGTDLTQNRAQDARRRPLGAYYRVNHKDIIAMHCALTEVGILYAMSWTHPGWDEVKSNGKIPFKRVPESEKDGHAFAIVGYNNQGFWIQNSWSDTWGKKGFCHILYDDWLTNGQDVWVARLGVAIEISSRRARAETLSKTATSAFSIATADVAPHLVSLGNDGRLRDQGSFGTNKAEVKEIFEDLVPAKLREKKADPLWKQPRILLYAHGGLVGEDDAVRRAAKWIPPLLSVGIYPVFFIWHSDLWSTLKNILDDALGRRRAGGVLETIGEFMEDRKDDMLEAVIRSFKLMKEPWREMKENAKMASDPGGGAHLVAELIHTLLSNSPAGIVKPEIHVCGHSAGSILFAPFMDIMRAKGHLVSSCTLWAPACTMDDFHDSYLQAIKSKTLSRFRLYTLSDAVERDDNCLGIYHKSLLYLVSMAFEEQAYFGLKKQGWPILGMERFLGKKSNLADPQFRDALDRNLVEWILCPNQESVASGRASNAMHHSDFDDDLPTIRSTVAMITGRPDVAEKLEF